MSQVSYNDNAMNTIELSPDVVFERISDVGSPSGSSLSYNPPVQDQFFSRHPNRRHTDSPVQSAPSTLPRYKYISPTSESSDSVSFEAGKEMASRPHRGYHTLDSGRKMPKQNSDSSSASDYGVAISIKGIKGHPFVILEDKENHRHMVPAPEPSDTSDVSSASTNQLPNGTVADKLLSSSKSGSLNKHTKEDQNPPDLLAPTYTRPVNAGSKRIPQGSRTMPYSDYLVKPSEIKAAQRSTPSPNARHMRSPRARNTHERSRTLPGRASERSRSLSPNRALASKPNRSRSVSPPRKSRSKPVDDNKTKPVSSLIGFFEKDEEPEKETIPRPKKSTYLNTYPRQSPHTVTTDGSSSTLRDARRRTPAIETEIEVTFDSRKPNLTVATATARSTTGTTPTGRYFALTSPAGTSPKPSIFGLRPKQPQKTQLTSPASSETGVSTDEGTLHLDRGSPRINTRSHDYRPNRTESKTPEIEPRHGDKPKRSGVSSEPLVKPSSGNSVFGVSDKKDKQFGKSKWSLADLVDMLSLTSSTDGPKQKQVQSNLYPHQKLVDNSDHGVEEDTIKPVDARDKLHDPYQESQTEPTKQSSTKVSKAKIVGPSHQLLKKTRRKRNAKRISTSNPGSRNVSGSEWSESEFSEGESLGISAYSSAGEDTKSLNNDEDEQSLPDVTSPVSLVESESRSPKRIIFGKIASQDITKGSEHIDGPVPADPLQLSKSTTVAELQDHIGQLRNTVKDLQRSADDNFKNHELLHELQDKLRDVEEEKKMLEDEISEGRKTLKDLERRLDRAQEEINSLRLNEKNERIAKSRQAKELEDLKLELNEMSDALDLARRLDDRVVNQSHLDEDLQHLRNEYDDLLAKQDQRERLLLKREEELLLTKKALREETIGHDEEVNLMRKMHDDVLSRLRQELEALRQESLGAVEARPLLEEQISNLRNELERLKENRRDVGSWNSSSSSDDDDHSSAVSRARAEAGKNKKLLLQSEQELKASKAAAEELRSELNFLQKKLNADPSRRGAIEEEQIKKLSSSLSQVREEKKNLESNLASLERQRATLRGQIQEARTEREDAGRTIRSLETEISRLKGKIQELENEVDRMKKELLRSRRQLEAQVYDLEHQVGDSDNRISQLQSQKSKLEKELSEAKDFTSSDLLNSLHDLDSKKLELESKLVEQENRIVTEQTDIENLHYELRRLSSSNVASAANQTLKELEDFKKKSASEIDSLRLELEAKAKALREADRNNSKLQGELRRMDSELEEELKEREATVAEHHQAKRALSEMEEHITALKREKEDREREMEKLQGMLSLVEDDKLNLEEKVDLIEKEKMNSARDLRHLREDIKDKDMELEELKIKIKNVQAEAEAERSKVSELEHHKYVTDMHVSGLKEALEAKYEEIGEIEAKIKKVEAKAKEESSRHEETVKKLRDVEKQRRLAAKEAEDLTVALGEKIAELDEAQRRLRRTEAQLSDMDEASSMATSTRLELDKLKKLHAAELDLVASEKLDAMNALAVAEANMNAMEDEMQSLKEMYETSASEMDGIDKIHRQLSQELDEVKSEKNKKVNALKKLEDKVGKLQTDLATSEEQADRLTNQLRDAERQRKNAEENSEELNYELKEKERKLKDAEKQIARLRDEIENFGEIGEGTKKALSNLEEARKDAEKEVDKVKKEAKELREQLQDQDDDMNLLKDKLRLAENVIKDEVQQSRKATDEKRKLQNEVLDLQRELNEKSDSFNKAQAAIKNIESKMKNYESGHDQLKQLRSYKEEADQKIEDLMEKIKKDRKKLKDAEASYYQSDQEKEASNRRCEEVEKELMLNNREILQLQDQIRSLESDVGVIKQEKKDTEKKCEALQNKLDLLELEMKERHNYSDHKQEELKEEVQALESELRSQEHELDKTVKEKIALQEKLAKLEADVVGKMKDSDNDLRKEIQQLRDSLDEKTQQIFAAEDTIYRQKEVIEELTTIQQEAEKSSLEQMEAYMGESDKQFQQLKLHLQEKNDVIAVFQQDKETLQNEMETLTTDLNRASSGADRIRSAYDKEQSRLEELEQLLKELRNRLKQEQKENSELKEQLSANLRSQSKDPDSEDEREKSRLHNVLEELEKKLHQSEEEKQNSFTTLEILQDKYNQLNSEIEIERSKAELLQSDSVRQKKEMEKMKTRLEQRSESDDDDDDVVRSLREQILTLEEKLEQEANELNAINTRHQRTEKKLREVLEQAGMETDKANSEKEMMNLTIKRLKDQLSETDNQLLVMEDDRRHLQEELREQTEVNYQLKQALTSSRHGTKTTPTNGNLFTSV